MANIYNGILLIHQKNENFPFIATSMDLEGIMLSGISQAKKDKDDITSMWNQKTKKLVNTAKEI